MSSPTASAEDFDARFREDRDPWGTDVRAYEREKAAQTLAALPDRPLGSVLEMGCGSGALTEQLAERCDHVLAADFSAEAVRIAAERTAALPNVRVEQRDLRHDWPAGPWDAIVCAEVLYYWAPDEVAAWFAAAERSLSPEGALVCVHWTGIDPDAPMDGFAVHDLLRRRAELPNPVSARHDGYVLDRFGS